MHTLVLASQSPRRKELLEKAGFLFSVSPVQISEIPNENLSLNEQIKDLAKQKARALVWANKAANKAANKVANKVAKGQRILILSADTLVIFNEQVLGKPKDLLESERYIRQLSGQTHRVTTGICLLDVDSGQEVVGHETTSVAFRKLQNDEIQRYVASRDGLDKAGAYGIQGEAGLFVESINGPIDNVVGLPVALLEKLLLENSWHVNRRKS